MMGASSVESGSMAMADWINAIILGVIEGLTEFIPVSSTGHLLLAQTFMGLKTPFWETFAVLIQLGAILAVVALYFAKLWSVVMRLPRERRARMFALSIIIAFLPAAVVGLGLHHLIKEVLFNSPQLICISLILGGLVLLVIDRFAPQPKQYDPMTLPLPVAFGIGLFQCLAIIPGVSRSGATIVGSMLLGVEKRAAAEFSFFLAIPTMAGAFVVDAWSSRDQITSANVWIIALGFVVSLIIAIGVIKAMLAIVTRRGYAPFGWWRIIVGVVGLTALRFAM
jgi:undecaprenyl-diphosphatase